MAKCDLCGCACRPVEMAQLLQTYQVGGIVDVCRECEHWATSLKCDLVAEHVPKLRAAILAKACTPTRPAPWWRRLLRMSP